LVHPTRRGSSFLEIEIEAPAALKQQKPQVAHDVEKAIGEYFESLNGVAVAVRRLLDDTPLEPEDAINCIDHAWHAHACDEKPEHFEPREDKVLTGLLKQVYSD